MEDKALALWICRRYDGLLNERRMFEPIWSDIAFHCEPSMGILPWNGTPNSTMNAPQDNNAALFDGTAARSANTFSSGQTAYLTPPSQAWFTFDPPRKLKDKDAVKQWYQKCSEEALLIIAKTTFYVEIQRVYKDDGVFGTYALYLEQGKDSPLYFKEFTIGTYVIAENEEGIVDTLFREIYWTASQCAEEFGEEALHPKMRKVLAEEGKSGALEQRFCIIHAMYPRKKRDREEGKADPQNKAYASEYVDKDNKHILKKGGTDEKPFFAGRYEKAGESVYGKSPAWNALPDSRQLNFLVKQLDALAEVKAFPRMLIPDTMQGEVDLSAGGPTFFDPNNPNAVPREWMTQGDYAIGLDREKRKEKAIEDAFFTGLFNIFSGMETQKAFTATQVRAMEGEKLNMFIPSFLRKTTELFNPMLTRVFTILYRGGYFPEPPQEAMIQDPATGEMYIESPDITYSSRVALAIQAQQNNSFSRTLETFAPILEMRPDVLDNFDMDKISRDGARNEGFPADWLVSEDAVEATREARAAAQAQQAQMQQEMAAAETAGKAAPALKLLQGGAA